MKISPDPLAIGEEDGFTSENDLFKRRTLGIGMINVVSRVQQPLVIAVDGAWGSGKTTFLKTWASELRKQKFPVVFFDAFENDYLDDAFAALARELVELVENQKSDVEQSLETFKEKAVNLGTLLLKSAGKIAIKAAIRTATAGAVSSDELADVVKDAASETEDVAEAYMEELLSKPKQQKEVVAEFRKALETLPLRLAPTKEGEDQKPLIYIIDELDRCKPLFALALLERVKHFMSVPNVHFVLGVHMRQLEASVHYAYGAETDARLYLQKFINVTMPFLPEMNERRGRNDYIDYCNHMVRTLDLVKDRSDELAISTIVRLACLHRLSLRSIERVLTSIALSVSFSNRDALRLGPIVGGLAVMKIVAPQLYLNSLAGELSLEEALGFLGFKMDVKNVPFGGMEWEQKWWVYCLYKEELPDFDQWGRNVNFRYMVGGRETIVPWTAKNVIEIFQL